MTLFDSDATSIDLLARANDPCNVTPTVSRYAFLMPSATKGSVTTVAELLMDFTPSRATSEPLLATSSAAPWFEIAVEIVDSAITPASFFFLAMFKRLVSCCRRRASFCSSSFEYFLLRPRFLCVGDPRSVSRLAFACSLCLLSIPSLDNPNDGRPGRFDGVSEEIGLLEEDWSFIIEFNFKERSLYYLLWFYLLSSSFLWDKTVTFVVELQQFCRFYSISTC